MSQSIYYVLRDESGWKIRNQGNEYTGYRSVDAARKSAIDVARKLSLNGHETQVVLRGGDAGSEVIWTSKNAPPTIESMMVA